MGKSLGWVRVRPGTYRSKTPGLALIIHFPHRPRGKRWSVTWKGMLSEHSREVATLAEAKLAPTRGR